MRPDDLYLAELLESTVAVRRYLEVGGTHWTDDPVVRDAVLHRLILVGEIAGAVSEEFRARHADVPWARIRAFRNTAIHEYFAVEWTTHQHRRSSCSRHGVAVEQRDPPRRRAG